MPTVTPKGYKLPITGERGTWWQNLIDNWLRMDAHTHDGSNSELISTAVLDKKTSDVSAANWVATTGGTYRQEITLPTGFTFPKVAMTFYVSGGGEDGFQIHPSVEKSATNKYYVYINDNTLDLKVVYA